MNQIETAFAACYALLASIAGGKISFMIADASQALPDWGKWLVGPLGGVATLLAVVWWMKGQIEDAKTTAKEDKATMLGLLEKITMIAANSTEAVRNSTNAINDSRLAIQRNDDFLEEASERLKNKQ